MKKYVNVAVLCVIFALGIAVWLLPTFDILWLAVILFTVGLLMIIKGGDVFVDAASAIARIFHIPSFIIGATIVSVATTLPEMLVSLFAAAEEGGADMAVGNAVGSVTANTALILAVSLIAMGVTCSRKDNLLQMLLLIGATVTLFVGCLNGRLNVVASVVLILIFVAFVAFNVVTGKRHSLQSAAEEESPINKKDVIINVLLFVTGAVALAGGSHLMVDYGKVIARSFGVSDLIVSLTIIAIGTSLPELVTAISAIIKKETNLSVGNIIGANIIDITLILPICSLIAGKQLPINVRSSFIDIPACVLVTLVAICPLIFRQKSSKLQGVALLILYAAYLAIVILCEVGVVTI